MKRWQWALRLLGRRVWLRASLFCLFAVALALASALVGHVIPYDFAARVGAKSVDSILNLLAASMLTVTTFSLTAMVQAYVSANFNISPRAVQLLIDDSTAQNALSTFLGSFLFAIAGIIALSTGVYGETGRVILYGGTVLVVGLIVLTLLRWIEHIARFGQMSDTIDRVEQAAMRAVARMVQRPSVGTDTAWIIPADAVVVRHDRIGRVTHVDLDELADVARTLGAEVTVMALPGTLADPARALAWTILPLDDALAARVRGAFTLAHARAFDHDPRFGLVVLGEIAARALSPAVNDPGTAIAVVEAGTRVLAAMLRHEPAADCAPPVGVRLPPFALPDLLDDLFRPIARDGAGTIEVGIRVQKALRALVAVQGQAGEALRRMARDALARADEALTSEADRAVLHRIAAG